jgi:hypothetical protein
MISLTGQGAVDEVRSNNNYKALVGKRRGVFTLYNAVLSTIAFDSHLTQQAWKSSLMMTHTCRNMW